MENLILLACPLMMMVCMWPMLRGRKCETADATGASAEIEALKQRIEELENTSSAPPLP